MANNTIDFPFSKFAPEATARGYEPVKYSQTGYYVKSTNGIRCEFQTTKGGVHSVGYGSSAKVVEALKAHINSVAGPKNKKIAELKGSINFAHESLEGFFDLVSNVESLKLDAPVKAGRPAVAKTEKPAKVAKPKAEKKAKAPKAEVGKLPDGTDMTVEDAISIATAKSEGKPLKTVDEIKAANLARLKAVGERMKKEQEKVAAQKTADEAIIEEMAPDFELPAFLENDISGGMKPAAE